MWIVKATVSFTEAHRRGKDDSMIDPVFQSRLQWPSLFSALGLIGDLTKYISVARGDSKGRPGSSNIYFGIDWVNQRDVCFQSESGREVIRPLRSRCLLSDPFASAKFFHKYMYSSRMQESVRSGKAVDRNEIHLNRYRRPEIIDLQNSS